MGDRNDSDLSESEKIAIRVIAIFELFEELKDYKAGMIIGDIRDSIKHIYDLIWYYDSLVCEVKKDLLMKSIIFKIQELNFEEERNVFWMQLRERAISVDLYVKMP